MTREIREILAGKYGKFKVTSTPIKKATQSLILESFGEDINLDSISYRKGEVRLKLDPLLKSEILIRKRFFVSKINSLLGSEVVSDIR